MLALPQASHPLGRFKWSLTEGITNLRCCRLGTKEWQLLPGLHSEWGHDTFITSKRTYDAFHGTELLEVLRQWHVKQVAICGCLTNCCCETTARHVLLPA